MKVTIVSLELTTYSVTKLRPTHSLFIQGSGDDLYREVGRVGCAWRVGVGGGVWEGERAATGRTNRTINYAALC